MACMRGSSTGTHMWGYFKIMSLTERKRVKNHQDRPIHLDHELAKLIYHAPARVTTGGKFVSVREVDNDA
jgi:hypothetical protein